MVCGFSPRYGCAHSDLRFHYLFSSSCLFFFLVLFFFVDDNLKEEWEERKRCSNKLRVAFRTEPLADRSSKCLRRYIDVKGLLSACACV